MLKKILLLSIVIGAVTAEPIERITSQSIDVNSKQSLVRSTRDIERLPTLISDLVKTLFGYKMTSLSLAVSAIDWIMTNIHTIGIGMAAVFGVCKMTSACGFDKPVSRDQYSRYITAEQLDSAERFFIGAMEEYVERKRREV